MKKIIFFFLVFIFIQSIYAQNLEDKTYLLTNKQYTLSLSTLSFIDPYLSPLSYNGIGIRYDGDSRRFLSPQNTKISLQNKLKLNAGLLLNPANTASMMYIGINEGWGLEYHFEPLNGLKLSAGGLWDIDFGFKDLERNVNNPINIDLATNLNITGIAGYDIQLRKKVLKLQLAIQCPLFGYLFVPSGGASYYDMFELGNLTNTLHFSSLYNKRGINQTYSIEVPFNRSIWRFGFGFDYLKYSANNMVFVKNEFRILTGITFDMATFAGRKNKAPMNFISTND